MSRRGLGLTLVMAILLSPAAPGAAAARARVSAPDGLNLRDAPSTSANVIVVLPYGTVVDVVGARQDGDWYEVGWAGRLGYASGVYLDFSPTVALHGNAAVSAPDGVRLRAAPSTDAAVLATLPPGRVVTIRDEPASDGWYHVQTVEGTGWVDGAYLQQVSAGLAPVLIRWYGHEFDGGALACGGIYSADDPSIAASTSYPCGTALQVCANSRCVNVVVRDRGAMGPGAIDLSRAAFARLASLDVGVLDGTVQIAVEGPAPAPPATPSPAAAGQ